MPAPPANERFFFRAGRSAASLAGIKIKCEGCARERSLAGSFQEGALSQVAQCCGGQPWLGRLPGEHSCRFGLQTVQRGGSNVYFPLVTSSIYIPPSHGAESEEIKRILDQDAIWQALTGVAVDGKVPDAVCKAFATTHRVDAGALADAATARLQGTANVSVATTEEQYRYQEYRVLSSGGGQPLDDLFLEVIEGSRFGWLQDFVARVGLVRKLTT